MKVLRRQPGDEVLVTVPGEGVFRALVEEVAEGGDRVVLRVGERLQEFQPTVVPWTVAVALVKGSGMDAAVRLASELGLESLVPLLSDRSQIRGAESGRPERWSRIALEAAKQCGRHEPLRVEAPWRLGDLLEASRGEAQWIARPGFALPPAAALVKGGAVRPALFLVGPEGGFSDDELRAAESAGARPIGFPTPVLRTTTAVVLIAALGVLLGGSGSLEEGQECG